MAALGLLTFAASGENGADNQSGVKNSNIATMVSVGTGLPAIPKKLVEKILSGEYVDFGWCTTNHSGKRWQERRARHGQR